MSARPRTHATFERFIHEHSLQPIAKVTEPDGSEIMIADGFHPRDSQQWRQGQSGDGVAWRESFPGGLYQTAWAVYRGGLDVLSWVECEFNHDLVWTESARQEGRVNAALDVARQWIAQNVQVGRYARH